MTSSPSSHQQARPVYIAALPREIAGLVASAGWRAEQKLLGRGIHLFEHEHAVIACAGMGINRVTLAVEAALTLGPASNLISIGWAGACNDSVKVGDVVHADIVVDARTGERFFTDEPKTGQGLRILVTASAPAGASEKERLGVSYYALVVDMEAAAVARLARAKDLPFLAIKAVSDEVGFALPDMAAFVAPDGHFREVSFAMHVALRPGLWRAVLRMAKSSKMAAANLQTELRSRIAAELDSNKTSDRNLDFKP